MNIDLLSKMVKELILDKDEVFLPGIGSFVAEFVPSAFSDKGYTINPPYRRLYFRQKQDDTDSTLVDFYADSNSIDKESAARVLTDFLNEMKFILQEKKLITFPELGRLRATKENNFFFVPDEDLDIFPAGFGLEPVSLKTHQETKEEVSAALSNLKSIIEEPAEEKKQEVSYGMQPMDNNDKPLDDTTSTEQDDEPIAKDTISNSEQNKEPLTKDTDCLSKQEESLAQPNTESAIDNIGYTKSDLWRTILKILLWSAITVAIAFIIFIIAARIDPTLTDRLLYNQEELEILYPYLVPPN